jgi:Kef-type K+ transport system membrane component KefB
MAKPVSNVRKTQVAHSWGILVGMLGMPILAVISKIFPQQDTVWEILLAVCGLVIIRSTVGYLFPGLGSSAKKAGATLPQTR